ncbi:MAG: hypothetical protein DHS20C19_25900 [Acidimicrobiales bacterium]|nr:MAG: hypothetical protein DHS20C19_25900 [Acidimicrobiales bacterium]
MSDNGNAGIPVENDEFDAFVVRAMLDAAPASVDVDVRSAEINAAVAAAESPIGGDGTESVVDEDEPDDTDLAVEAAREREIDALLADDFEPPAVDIDFALPSEFSEPASTLADAVDDGFLEPDVDDLDTDDDADDL